MVIPRLLSRATSAAAQLEHFRHVLDAAPELPAVIYNSPYYGFETKADLFFKLRKDHPNLIGFKEFGGAAALSYAAEHITSQDSELCLLVGVDTQVYHGYLNCGACGAITGVGNALPDETLMLIRLLEDAVRGNAQAKQYAFELSESLKVLSTFDEGPDLVLYYKQLMTLEGTPGFEHHINPFDRLSQSQQSYVTAQWLQFREWWKNWQGQKGLHANETYQH